jgi:acetylornithine/succinyldiaminopimelate/putrescine aminotransferase/predicted amino acid dehydrogenase/long-subunit acyl-CoA synthetase (AMP-forming)
MRRMSPIATPNFSEVIASPVPLDFGAKPSNVAEIIFRQLPEEDDRQTIIHGTISHRPLTISLGCYRRTIVSLSRRLKELGLSAGDAVCLARLPRTSETLTAVVYGALASAGMRVLFPMYLDAACFSTWLQATHAKAIFWAADEAKCEEPHEADSGLTLKLEQAARQINIPTYCFEKDLHLSALLLHYSESLISSEEIKALCAASTADDFTLVLTTSGTNGKAKLVSYRQRALLNCCASWAAAGFFTPDKLGGRCLCLLLAHSMGLRAFWNAMWTRQPLCLIPPEWFFEHPDRVRALLMEMKPQHVTGGPATFHTILELSRAFPQIKDSCFQHLRCAVSSGAPFDPALAEQIQTALGLHVENAFGMTETMQVVSTMAAGPLLQISGFMGNPLPGVKIGLQPDRESGAAKMWVHTPFGFDGYVTPAEDPAGIRESNGLSEWFDTGDLVQREPEGLRYLGRAENDFVKDGYGVKVSRALLLDRYRDLASDINHIEIFPLAEEPGLAALVFLKGPAVSREHGIGEATPWIRDYQSCRRIRGLIEARNEKLLTILDDFELRHLTIARFACIPDLPPVTAKGNISKEQIERRYAQVLKLLIGRWVHEAGIVRIKRERLLQPAYTRLASPRRGQMLHWARLDKKYVRAERDYLYYEEKGEQKQVLDLVGGFGINLLGHRHPALIAAAAEFAASSFPWIADQGSIRHHEGEVSSLLAAAVGDATGQAYIVRLANTGAEAVEMALVHAFLERHKRWTRWKHEQQRRFGHRAPELLSQTLNNAEQVLAATPPHVIVFEGSFHGYSLGARSLQGGAKSRPFLPMTRLVRCELDINGTSDIDALIASHDLLLPALTDKAGKVIETEVRFSSIIAAIYEPVRGEGGICETPADLVHPLQNRQFPLIADEIQCGLGRTGSFLGSHGIHANYYLFGKALGGGLAKIAALLIEQPRYVLRFDEHYATTFGGDSFSSAIASRVLQLIKSEDIPGRAAERGARLKEALSQIAASHPKVIRSITGCGLMLGIHFAPEATEHMFALRLAEQSELLGLACAAYLLNRHQLRLLPTISAPNTLRIEPSAFITDDDISHLQHGLESLCRAMENHDSAEIVGCLVEEEISHPSALDNESDIPPFSTKLQAPSPQARRIGFIAHFLMPEREIAMIDPSLASLPQAARRALVERLIGLTEMKPTPLMARNLFNGQIWFSFILIGVDAAGIEEMNRSGKHATLIHRIQEGVEMAARQGCEIVSLGAYTSIVTRDGRAIHPPAGIRLTTGNSLTVAVGVHRIIEAVESKLKDRPIRLAVVGATGNIGSALSRRLLIEYPGFAEVTLVARNLRRLKTLADELILQSPGIKVNISADLSSIRGADAVVIAASTNEPLIYPHHISSDHIVVLADISAPAVISPILRDLKNIYVIPIAGAVALPGEPDFVMASHIPAGTAFCCAAEAILLGLAAPSAIDSLSLLGRIDQTTVDTLTKLAKQNGFLPLDTPQIQEPQDVLPL